MEVGQTAEHGQADAESDEALFVFDIGSVMPKGPIEHQFQIRNSSPFDWKVDRIESGCKCGGTWTVCDAAVPPGGILEGKGAFRAPEEDGDVARDANLVLANDGGRIRVRVRAKVILPLVASPKRLEMKSGMSADADSAVSPQTAILEIESRVADGGELSVAQAPRWCKIAEISPIDVARGDPVAKARWRLRVDVVPKELNGAQRADGFLVLRQNGDELRSLTVPIGSQISQALTVYPSQLYFERIEPGQVGARDAIVVLAAAADGVPIVSASPEIKNCTATSIVPIGHQR